MKKIILMYWNRSVVDLPYERGQEFDYSENERNEIINTCINLGFSVMLVPDLSLIIWVVKGKFTQN